MKNISYIIVIVFVSFYLCSCTQKQSDGTLNIAFVKNNQLIEGFEMTKDISKQSLTYFESIQNKLDSLKLNIEKLEFDLLNDSKMTDLEKNEYFNNAYTSFLSKKEELENELSIREQENQTLVVKRLNVYIEEFANDQDYDLIIGSNGNGNVLYGENHLDITESLIAYANGKYQNN